MEISENNGEAIGWSYGVPLTVTNSTIANNNVASPAAISLGSTTATFTNDTISGNRSTGSAAGLMASFSTVTLTNVTVANNQADINNTSGSSLSIGGIEANVSATITLNDCIVADNLAGATGYTVAADLGQPFYGFGDTFSGSYNLIGYDPVITNGINNGTNGNQVGGESALPRSILA